jgi:thioesterase domain-containing protein
VAEDVAVVFAQQCEAAGDRHGVAQVGTVDLVQQARARLDQVGKQWMRVQQFQPAEGGAAVHGRTDRELEGFAQLLEAGEACGAGADGNGLRH